MFGLGFLVQGGVKLLGALPRMHKNPKAILHALIHQDNFRLGAFLGCFSAIFKVSIHLNPTNVESLYNALH